MDPLHFNKFYSFIWRNDTFGHHFGDEVILQFARSLKKLCRKSDVVGRLGGDEFMVILPETLSQKAKMFMQRLIDYWKNEMEFLNPDGKIHSMQFSAGICDSNDATTHTELIVMADKMLYRSKKSGVNDFASAPTLSL